MGIVISVIDLWKEYAFDSSATAALRGANMHVESGQIVALLGKSGSGKTTLLNLIAGLDRPTRGKVLLDGTDLDQLGERGRTELRRRRIGFVFQFFNLLPTLTVMENVMLSLELMGTPDIERVRKALRGVELEDKADRYPSQLSGGEQQRVSIARAMVKEPALILADEPTGNLDVTTGDQVMGLLADQCRSLGATLLMVTHSQLTCRFADRMVYMVDGRPEEAKRNL